MRAGERTDLRAEADELMTRDSLLGKRFGAYLLQRRLGQGTLGQAYLAVDTELGVPVVVKVLSPGPERRPLDLDRLLSQAGLLLRLKHPRIITLRDIGRNGDLYLVLEWVEGVDLRRALVELLGSGERLPSSEVARLGRDIAEALAGAHQLGVLHGDLKPSNILIDREGKAMVGDFGIAAALRTGMQDWGPDTPRYAAPELALSPQGMLPQSDVYSLGVLLFELATGRVPFDDPYAPTVAIQHIRLPVPPPRSINPEISPALETAILRALEKEPQARQPSASALAHELRQAFPAEEAGSSLLGDRPSPVADRTTLPPEAREPGSPRLAHLVRQAIASGPRPAEGSPPSRSPRRVFPNGPGALPWTGIRSCLVTLFLIAVLGLVLVALRSGTSAADATGSAPALTPTLASTTGSVEQPTSQSGPVAVPMPLPTGPAAPNIVMVYGSNFVAVVNDSDPPLSLAGVKFSRLAPDGSYDATFDPAAWNQVAARPIQALPARDCYLLLVLNERLTRPDSCQDVQGWIATSNQNWQFWRGGRDNLYFAVLHHGRTIHICPIEDGRCTFYLPQP